MARRFCCRRAIQLSGASSIDGLTLIMCCLGSSASSRILRFSVPLQRQALAFSRYRLCWNENFEPSTGSIASARPKVLQPSFMLYLSNGSLRTLQSLPFAKVPGNKCLGRKADGADEHEGCESPTLTGRRPYLDLLQ